MQYLKTLDYILFVILMVGGIWGAIKGFLDELSSKFGLVLGFMLALMFTHALAPVFQNKLGFPLWFAAFSSYFIIFIVGYLFVRIIGSVLFNIVDTANISVLDNILGFFLGLVEAFIMIAAFEYILGYQNLFNLQPVFEESLFSSKLILPFANACVSLIKSVI
jgi:uncharacterized membrane protein required for colicin V production